MEYNARLIYNPTAGSFPSGVLAQKLAEVFISDGWMVEISPSKSGKHVTHLAKEAAERGYKAVFLAGGDGTIHLALESLVGTETALGVIPAGTANVLAQELGLFELQLLRTRRFIEATQKISTGKIQLTDIGLCNGQPFLLWAGVGLDGFVIQRIEPRKRWEKQLSLLHYASKAVWNVHFWNGQRLDIHTDHEHVIGKYLMVVASNIRLYAGGLAELSPSAKLDDGLMDLWLIEGSSPLDIYQRALSLFSRRHLNSTHINAVPFRKAQIESASTLYAQLDAEPYSGDSEITLQVLPRSLRLIVPEDVRKDLFAYPAVERLGHA